LDDEFSLSPSPPARPRSRAPHAGRGCSPSLVGNVFAAVVESLARRQPLFNQSDKLRTVDELVVIDGVIGLNVGEVEGGHLLGRVSDTGRALAVVLGRMVGDRESYGGSFDIM
jgi:hypothetical protein